MEKQDPILENIKGQQKKINEDIKLIKKQKEPVGKMILTTSILLFFVLFFGFARTFMGLM